MMKDQTELKTKQQTNSLINTYAKKDDTHLMISTSRVEDKAFLNIFGNSWGDIA